MADKGAGMTGLLLRDETPGSWQASQEPALAIMRPRVSLRTVRGPSLETAKSGIAMTAVAFGIILTAKNARPTTDDVCRRKLKRSSRPRPASGSSCRRRSLPAPAAGAYIASVAIAIEGGLSLDLDPGV